MTWRNDAATRVGLLNGFRAFLDLRASASTTGGRYGRLAQRCSGSRAAARSSLTQASIASSSSASRSRGRRLLERREPASPPARS